MALIGNAVSEENIFEIVDDGRTTDHVHPVSLPCEPNGSGELKIDIPLETQVMLYKSGESGGTIVFVDMFS